MLDNLFTDDKCGSIEGRWEYQSQICEQQRNFKENSNKKHTYNKKEKTEIYNEERRLEEFDTHRVY